MLDLMQFGPTPSCRGVSREDQWHLLARALCSVHTSIKILIFKFVPVYRGPQVFFVSKRTNTHVHYCQTKISNKTLYSYLRSTTIRQSVQDIGEIIIPKPRFRAHAKSNWSSLKLSFMRIVYYTMYKKTQCTYAQNQQLRDVSERIVTIKTIIGNMQIQVYKPSAQYIPAQITLWIIVSVKKLQNHYFY